MSISKQLKALGVAGVAVVATLGAGVASAQLELYSLHRNRSFNAQGRLAEERPGGTTGDRIVRIPFTRPFLLDVYGGLPGDALFGLCRCDGSECKFFVGTPGERGSLPEVVACVGTLTPGTLAVGTFRSFPAIPQRAQGEGIVELLESGVEAGDITSVELDGEIDAIFSRVDASPTGSCPASARFGRGTGVAQLVGLPDVAMVNAIAALGGRIDVFTAEESQPVMDACDGGGD